MDQIKELIVDYHSKLNDFVSSGAIPGDSFFELEDEILQYYHLVPPDTYYYQSALQLKMAKINATDAEGILKELSDFIIPLQNKIDGLVWICDPKLIEIASVTKGMYDMLIEYEELECKEDENCVYSYKPATLHFDGPSQLRILLNTYGYNADVILAELDALQEVCSDEAVDCIHFKNIRRNYDSLSKCMISATIDNDLGAEENLVQPHDVIEVWAGYSQLDEALKELYRVFHGEEFQPQWLPKLKTHMLEPEPNGMYDTECNLVLFSFYDALGSIQSDMINGRYLHRLIHQYLLRHRYYFNPETLNRLLERILLFAKENEQKDGLL